MKACSVGWMEEAGEAVPHWRALIVIAPGEARPGKNRVDRPKARRLLRGPAFNSAA